MKPLYTQQQFNIAKSQDKLLCECYQCNNPFSTTKYEIKRALQKNNKSSCKFCSLKCRYESQITQTEVSCQQCDKKFNKTNAEIKKVKNNFCSRSCSAIYRNSHKTHGTRRSKLEVWLEEQLTSVFPYLPIDFNKKDAINSELDIYIPSLKLAFELNGIFHYEPIFGCKKLEQTQNNDQRKFKSCADKQISLCIIDVSTLKYFKPDKAKKYLDIIISIINEHIKFPQ